MNCAKCSIVSMHRKEKIAKSHPTVLCAHEQEESYCRIQVYGASRGKKAVSCWRRAVRGWQCAVSGWQRDVRCWQWDVSGWQWAVWAGSGPSSAGSGRPRLAVSRPQLSVGRARLAVHRPRLSCRHLLLKFCSKGVLMAHSRFCFLANQQTRRLPAQIPDTRWR